LKRFISISDFENDITSYSMYKVQQKDPRSHVFITVSFTEVRILLSRLPILLFKNDNCEVHIHNINRVSKTKYNDGTIYTLYCLDYSGQKAHTHTFLIICR